MKTKSFLPGAAAGVFWVATLLPAGADQPAAAVKTDRIYTGTVVSANAHDRTLKVQGFLFSRHFNVGANCPVSLLDQPDATLADVRPGQKVRIAYQDAHGVLIADRVQQEPMRVTGTVKAIEPAAHKLTLYSGGQDKTFQLPEDCPVTLRGGKTGTLADLQTGDYVTVTYETPQGQPTARRIAQTSQQFTGELVAVDLNTRTVKAKALFDTKTFHLGDPCAIVVNGQPNGRMTDLKLGERFTINYDEVNGVNIANRIAPAASSPEAAATAVR
jgi:Cu/Ag efflux protein CusF